MLEPSTAFFTLFSKSIKHLLWNKRPKMATNRLVQTTENTGIGLKDPKTLMKALHSSFMLRLIFSDSPVSLAISEHYNLTPKNLKAHPTDFVFKKPVSWLRLFFTGFLQPKLSKGLFLIHNKSKNHLVFHSTPLRCVSVFPVSNQDIRSYTNIKHQEESRLHYHTQTAPCTDQLIFIT